MRALFPSDAGRLSARSGSGAARREAGTQPAGFQGGRGGERSGGGIARGRPVKASSTYAEPGNDYRPENAVDGLPDTRWSSEFSDPQWLAIDLGAPTRISRVILDWEAACAESYAIQVSLDGNTWTDVYTTTNGKGDTEDIKFAPATARWVRLLRHPTGHAVRLFALGDARVSVSPRGNSPVLPEDSPGLTVPGVLRCRRTRHGLFPLTPALSLGERGPLRPRPCQTLATDWPTDGLRLPSPQGRGPG